MSHFRRRAREGWRSRPHHVEQRTDEAFPIPWVGVPIVPPSRGWNLVEPTDLLDGAIKIGRTQSQRDERQHSHAIALQLQHLKRINVLPFTQRGVVVGPEVLMTH